MAVRVFDGVDDVIVLDEGTTDNIFNGAFTLVVGFRKDAETTDVTQFLLSFDAGVNTNQRAAMSLDGSNNLQLTISGLTRTFTGQSVTNGTHYMWIVTKASGTATPRANLFSYSSDTWSGWTNGSDTLDNDTTALVEIRIGNGPGSFPLSGRFWLGAAFTSVIADATAEGFSDSAADVLTAGPAAMWRPGLTDPVADDTGNGASQTSIVGTTTDSSSDPDPFNFAITEAPPNVGYQSTSIHPGRGPSRIARFIQRSMSTELSSFDSIVSATTVAASTTITTPSIETNSIVSATTVAGSTTIPAPTLSAGSTVAASTVATSTTIPTPAISAGGSATVIAVTVAGTTSVSTPTIQAGSTVSATTVAGSASIATPTIPPGPATVTATTVIPTPTVGAGSTISAVTVPAITTIAVPQIVIITQPAVVSCVSTIPTPTISAGSVLVATRVLATTTIPFPTIVAIVPPPLLADYVVDLTPVSIPISNSGVVLESDATTSA